MVKILTHLKRFLYCTIGFALISCSGDMHTNSAGAPAPSLEIEAPASLNILVIGGTEGIGLQTVKLALKRGHTVSAVARRPERMALSHPNLQTIKGDILKPGSIESALARSDAVVVAIGIGPTRKPVTVFSEGTATTLAAMRKNGVQRLVVVTGIGAGDSRGHGGFFYDRILQPLLLATIYEDKDRAEKLITGSQAKWTIVRPATLTDGASAEEYRVIIDMDDITAGKISRADTAHFIVSAIEQASHIGATVLLTN